MALLTTQILAYDYVIPEIDLVSSEYENQMRAAWDHLQQIAAPKLMATLKEIGRTASVDMTLSEFRDFPPILDHIGSIKSVKLHLEIKITYEG